VVFRHCSLLGRSLVRERLPAGVQDASSDLGPMPKVRALAMQPLADRVPPLWLWGLPNGVHQGLEGLGTGGNRGSGHLDPVRPYLEVVARHAPR